MYYLYIAGVKIPTGVAYIWDCLNPKKVEPVERDKWKIKNGIMVPSNNLNPHIYPDGLYYPDENYQIITDAVKANDVKWWVRFNYICVSGTVWECWYYYRFRDQIDSGGHRFGANNILGSFSG